MLSLVTCLYLFKLIKMYSNNHNFFCRNAPPEYRLVKLLEVTTFTCGPPKSLKSHKTHSHLNHQHFSFFYKMLPSTLPLVK